jgi:cell division protein FtsQ
MNSSPLYVRLILFLCLISLCLSAWFLVDWLYKPGNFKIKKIELIKQLKNQESNELQKVAAHAINGGFFSLDVDQFRVALLTNLPWVKSVAVRKIWPDKLLIAIVEYQPFVRWQLVKKTISRKRINKKKSIEQADCMG